MYFSYGARHHRRPRRAGRAAPGDLVLRRGLHRDGLRPVPHDPEPEPARRATSTITYYLRRAAAPSSATLTVGHSRAHRRRPRRRRRASGAARRSRPRSTVEPNGGRLVVERPMYFTYRRRPSPAATTSLGADGAARRWYFAEGYTGRRLRRVPDDPQPERRAGAGHASPTTWAAAGAGRQDARRRRPTAAPTVAVHDAAPGRRARPGGHRQGRRRPTPADRRRAADVLQLRRAASPAATTSLGAPAPGARWYFAEGYTGAGFDEYLTILNPEPRAGAGRAHLLPGGGRAGRQERSPSPANARATVAVHDAPRASGAARRSRRAVETTQWPVGIVVERPMYFRYGPGMTGGHVVVGAPG